MKRIALALGLSMAVVPSTDAAFTRAQPLVVDVHRVRMEDVPASVYNGSQICPIRHAGSKDCLPWSYVAWVKRVLVNFNEHGQNQYKTFWVIKDRFKSSTQLIEYADDGTMDEKCTHCNDKRL